MLVYPPDLRSPEQQKADRRTAIYLVYDFLQRLGWLAEAKIGTADFLQDAQLCIQLISPTPRFREKVYLYLECFGQHFSVSETEPFASLLSDINRNSQAVVLAWGLLEGAESLLPARLDDIRIRAGGIEELYVSWGNLPLLVKFSFVGLADHLSEL